MKEKMRPITAEEEAVIAEMAETDPEAAETIRECWAMMSDEGRERFVRFAERLAKLPHDLDPTEEQLEHMVKNDSDIPLH